MTFWVAQKTSLYSLVATAQCTQKLLKENTTVVVTEATWQDIERDLPRLDPDIADELQALRGQGRVQTLEPAHDRLRAVFQQHGGQISLRLCGLCAMIGMTHGTLLTESVPVMRGLSQVPGYPYTTGVTIARGWLASTPSALAATEYVERAERLLMLTPHHPEAGWWFAHIRACD